MKMTNKCYRPQHFVWLSTLTFLHVFCYQGKPTESSKEAKIQNYGESEAKDYIPGAEVLEVEEKGDEEEDEGM